MVDVPLAEHVDEPFPAHEPGAAEEQVVQPAVVEAGRARRLHDALEARQRLEVAAELPGRVEVLLRAVEPEREQLAGAPLRLEGARLDPEPGGEPGAPSSFRASACGCAASPRILVPKPRRLSSLHLAPVD